MTHNKFMMFAATWVALGCGGVSRVESRVPPHASAAAEQESAPSTASEESAPGSFSDARTAKSGAPAAESAPREASSGATAGRSGLMSRSQKALSPEPAPAPPKDRPGLATSWGETRRSWVSTSPFEREEPEHPFAIAWIHYNDRQGIEAMLGRGRRPSFSYDSYSSPYSGLRMRLIDESGRPLPTLETAGRNYVAGEDGARYSIEVSNNTPYRFEAVATVDGLDVIDGRHGSFEKRGYLLRPGGRLVIDGFRQSTETVAAFRFGSVRDSYAARKGDDRNVGVIGVAFFQEAGSQINWRERPPSDWTDDEVERRENADPFPGRFASPPPGAWNPR